MSYQPIDRSKVVNFVVLRDDIEVAAAELFHAYAKALPDKDRWTEYHGWNNSHGIITFGGSHIEYSKEVYSHGDTDYYRLELPMSALYNPDFIPQAVEKWEAVKAESAAHRERQIVEQAAKDEARQRAHYEELKKKYDR